MILQPILFPNTRICEKRDLYFRPNKKTTFKMDSRAIQFNKGGIVKFNTYFNSFSLNKWKAYTSIENLIIHLHAHGRFVINVRRAYIKDNNLVDEHLFADFFEEEYTGTLDVQLGGIIYFMIECISEEGGEFLGGAFEADIDESLLNDVKICMGVCTFRREQYITANLKAIKKQILNNKESPLYNRLDIYVSDNANTLPLDFKNKHIRIFYNPNTGGSGGFTRTIMEALHDKDEKHFTHVLLTDDDIRLDPAAVEKLGVFLRCVQDKYRESFIGGSMFRLDQMHIQSEVANRWEIGPERLIPYKHRANMNLFANVVKNELPIAINHFGWWFCCMPIGVMNESNLPLPIFIKRDDIEYGLRNGGHFITLNGINVWHEPFEIKRPAYLDYYYIRNLCIMESTLGRNISLDRMIHKTRQMFIDTFTRFKYLEFQFYCRGVEDFCRGIDWLKNVDAVELNKDLLAHDRKLLPYDELPIPYDEAKYNKSNAYSETKRHFRLRKYTLNGWLLPSKKEYPVIQSAFPRKYPFFRAKKVLMVEKANNRGYIAEKSWKEFFHNLRLCFKTEKILKKYYNYAALEYTNRWHELITIDAWKTYLFTERDQSINDSLRPAKNEPVDQVLKRKMEDIYVKERSKPIFEKMVYIESKRGIDFDSNIFAVAKELQKPEYDDFDIVMSTEPSYKDTLLAKIKNNNLNHLRVIIRNSPEFQKVMARAKYFITDFHLFPHFAKRPEQVVVSLWHGTPLKTLGKECKGETHISVERIMDIADYQVYPGEFMEKKMLELFWQENLYKGNVLCSGYPRNALFFDDERRKQIRDELMLGDKTAIIYMPTFRGEAGNFRNDEQNRIIEKYFEEIDAKLTDNQIFYVKLHYFNAAAIDLSKFKHIVSMPSKYDTYEFQNACDILVTDYSSVFFDFAVCRRKIILFQYDQDSYFKARGILFSQSELPFPIVTDTAGVIDEINKPIEYDDRPFLKKFATYDNKDAVKNLCEHVVLGKALPEGVKEYKLKHSKKKKIYIYCGSLKDRFSAYNNFWKYVNTLDYDKFDYYLMYYDPHFWKNAYRLLPINDKCNQIGMWSFGSYTTKEYKTYQKMMARKPLDSKEKQIMSDFYDRELIKHFGYIDQPFAVVLFNSRDVHTFNMFAKYGTKRVAVFPDDYKVPVSNPNNINVLGDAIQNGDYRIVRFSEFNEYIETKMSKKNK